MSDSPPCSDRPASRFTRSFGRVFVWAGAMATLHSGVAAQDATVARPNIVVMLIDDMGWTDAGAYGSTFYETPAIDALAADGVRFTSFYTASPVCSPTRASLMTGKHPARLRITNWIGGEQAGRLLQAEYHRELPLEEVTVGEAFAEAGYATGYIGKWHLGIDRYMPGSQGFERVLAVNRGGQPSSYFRPYSNARTPQLDVPDLGDGPEGEYLTDRLTDEAIRFLEANRDRPFLLVLSHYAVHTPLQAKPEPAERYRARAASLPDTAPAFRDEGANATTKLRQDHAVYAAMIESVDRSLGRVVEALGRLGIGRSTILVFVSDNGGLTTLAGSNRGMPTAVLPLRAGKGWLYEGGIRAPLIVRWPGTIRPGASVDATVTSTDLFPTLLELAGLNPRPLDHVDGQSFAPLLRGDPAPPARPLFWHFPHYHGSGNTPSSAVRLGDYKLIEWLEDGRTELYDLAADIGETRDLSGLRPAQTQELLGLLHRWRREIGALMPRPNPDYRGETAPVRHPSTRTVTRADASLVRKRQTATLPGLMPRARR